jgi:hypothetical protein
VDTLPLGRDGWSFSIGSYHLVYDSSNSSGNFVDRYGASSLEAFTVRLDAPSPGLVSVHYHTADGTARAGQDYIAAAGTITFPPGLTAQTIVIPTLDDNGADATRTFTVDLSNPVGAVLSRSQGIGTILENATDSDHAYAAQAAQTNAGLGSFLVQAPPSIDSGANTASPQQVSQSAAMLVLASRTPSALPQAQPGAAGTSPEAAIDWLFAGVEGNSL